MTEVPRWLADPALEPVWRRVSDALEQRGLLPTGRIVLTGMERTTRHAVAGILGRPVLTDRARIDLAELDQFLRERSRIGGLREVVEAIQGEPLTDKAALRSAHGTSRQAPFAAAHAWLAAHPETRLPWADEWLAGLRRTGYLTKRRNPVALIERALEILAERDSGTDIISRADLAARTCGDAHALDDDRPLTHLVLRGLATAYEMEYPISATQRRTLWERASVQTDTVSSTCLTFGLRDGLAHLTLWDLQRTVVHVPSSKILVCENPRVLEAFAEQRPEVAVVCTSGEPNLVTLDVLRTLRDSRAEMRYHGDFDWPGIAITNRLIHALGVCPWRMSATDYRQAVQNLPDQLELTGAPVIPDWEAELGRAMVELGTAVHEESVLETLITSF
ncbi:TIGR02679 family protein [Sciscionella marina]|uniref:TIGR02679 family protein n=1 Tax=Sciscionella marina TaxID=508770 RepID=UPI00036D6E20|nr:TIGR02679 family protein [Sciscionella marina]